ncbi:hypothetical protein GGI08_000553 [Coemansia sp. S2]|nr:hypothetical protein GGI08_000553 [Coemansia sp. S2]
MNEGPLIPLAKYDESKVTIGAIKEKCFEIDSEQARAVLKGTILVQGSGESLRKFKDDNLLAEATKVATEDGDGNCYTFDVIAEVKEETVTSD